MKPEDRFWSKVDKSGGADACWPWTGCKKTGGRALPYGFASVGGKSRLAHRVSWEMANGTIPAGACILHRCDNASCVNPAHLFAGTQVENMADMATKGRARSGAQTHPERHPRGVVHGQAKLTERGARELRRLRASGVTLGELGRRFGISKRAVGMVVRRETWGHVDG